MITQEYLIKNGFKRDKTCPEGVNRWEKQDGKMGSRNWHVSVTLTPEGNKALYGIANFYSISMNVLSYTGYYEYISLHRYFNGEITVKDFNRMLNRNAEWINRNP